MKKLKSYLPAFFYDAEGNLSLTNLLLLAFSLKMLITPALDWSAASILLLPFANYALKRHTIAKNTKINSTVQDQLDSTEEKIKEIHSKVNTLQVQKNITNGIVVERPTNGGRIK